VRMRIVTGSARGRTLRAPDGSETRPTSDRVKEAIFNALFSLNAIEGAQVLDLFAGSGGLGLEALSRGAAHCTFIDSSRPAIRAINDNIEACGFTDVSTVIAGDVLRWLERSTEEFDLIVCDPPYAFDDWATVLEQTRGSMLVIESGREIAIDGPWVALRSRRYGSTIVSILESTAGEDTSIGC